MWLLHCVLVCVYGCTWCYLLLISLFLSCIFFVLGLFFFFCFFFFFFFFFFSSRRRHTRLVSDWSSDVCSSDLGGLLDLGEGLRLFLDGDVFGGEAVVDIHAELALRQVAHVPHRRLDRVARAEVLADRLRLGGRFDDHERTPAFPPGRRPGVSRAGRRATLATLHDLHILHNLHIRLFSSHASILRQRRESASLPSGAGLRKPDDLARHFFGRLALGVQLRVRLEVKRLALLQQLAHPVHRILTY